MTPIAAARLAPVLSATSRIERICNIKNYSLLTRHRRGLGVSFDDFHQAPSFEFGKRTAFLDPHAVARACLALFVMRVKFFVLSDNFLELGMREPALHANDDRFGHLVGEDFSNALFAVAADNWCAFSHIKIG